MNKLVLFIIFIICNIAIAAEVIMVQRDFPMSKHEQLKPADLFINKAFKQGELVSLARKLFIKTANNKNKLMEITVPYCLVRVIYSDSKLSIAHLVYMKKEIPNLGLYAPILGDEVMAPPRDLVKEFYHGKKAFVEKQEGTQAPKVLTEKIEKTEEKPEPKLSPDPIQKSSMGKPELTI